MLSRQGNTRAYGPAANDPVRLVGQIAAVLSIGAGVIHISAAGDHTELPVMFAGFMLVALLQIALGVLLIWRPPSRLLIFAAIAMTLSSIGLWVLSRTAGLPLLPDGHVEPVGFKDGVTKLFEIASVPALLLLLTRDLANVSVPPRLGNRAITVLGTACLALMPPALLLGGGHQHSHAEAVALGLHAEHDASAHADSHSSDHAHGESTVRHTHETHGDGAHHTSTRSGGGGHDHSVLASAPLGATHHHTATQSPGDHHTHHSEEDVGSRHHDGEHRNHSGNKHDGGNHGDGHGHGHGHEHEPPEAEPAISISYEPEPSVCVGGTLCIP